MSAEQVLPLIGRGEVITELVRLTSTEASPGVIISGASGVGKTRVAEATVAALTGNGRRVLRAAASGSARGLPLAALARWLPTQAAGSLEGPVERALRGLSEVAAGSQLVLFVDDAHLLDDVSAVVLHQAVLSGQAQIISTVRADEPVPGALAALWRDSVVPRIDLPPLTEVDVIELVTTALGDPVDGATLRRVWLATAGNALYLRELLTAAREAGVLVRQDGFWRLTSFPAKAPRLTQLLQARLAGVSANQRELLELLSVAEPIGLALLTRLADSHDIEAMERAGLIAVAASGRRLEAQLAHPLYAELLRGEMPAIAALRYNRQIAEAVEALPPRRRDDTLRLAVWRLDGGGEAAPGPMLAAARHAEMTNDIALAERLARRAFESDGGAQAAIALALALGGLGKHDEAAQVLANVPLDDDEARFGVAFVTFAHQTMGYDDSTSALRAVEDALAAVRSPRLHELLRALHVIGLVDSRRPAEAAALATELACSPTRDIRALARLGLSIARLQTGELAESIAEGTEVWEQLATTLGIAMPLSIYVGWRATALSDLPDLRQAAAEMAAAYSSSLTPRADDQRGWAAFGQARVALAEGRLVDAGRWAKEAAAIFARLHQPAAMRWCAALRLLAAAQRGDIEESQNAARSHGRYPVTSRSAMWADNDSARAVAWYAAVRGDLASARRVLRDEVADAAARGLDRTVTIAALDLVRLGASKMAHEVLTRHPPSSSWPLGRIAAGYAAAAAAHSGPELVDCARTFEQMSLLLHAAEAMAMAAAALEASGDGRGAQRTRLASVALGRRCGSPDTPALRQIGPMSTLSAREYDIALLAARGDTNKTIAESLVISERTVENHLLRAYAKLGVSGRTELADALRNADPAM